MKKYYVNKTPNTTGEHEVHNDDCAHLPSDYNRVDLGYHSNSKSALEKAKMHYNNVDGCFWCCREIHTK